MTGKAAGIAIRGYDSVSQKVNWRVLHKERQSPLLTLVNESQTTGCDIQLLRKEE